MSQNSITSISDQQFSFIVRINTHIHTRTDRTQEYWSDNSTCFDTQMMCTLINKTSPVFFIFSFFIHHPHHYLLSSLYFYVNLYVPGEQTYSNEVIGHR